MLLAYLAAAAIAAGAAYGAADYEKLPYWRRWDRAATRVALGLICAFFAIVGLAVTALAQHQQWEILSSGGGRALANGVVYGAVAFVLLRVDFTGFGFSTVSPARNLLKFHLARVDPRLTSDADRNVTRRLGDLKPKQLCSVSLDLFLRYMAPELDVDVAEQDLERLMALHVAATQRGDADELVGDVISDTARGLLRYFCERLIVDNLDSTIELPD